MSYQKFICLGCELAHISSCAARWNDNVPGFDCSSEREVTNVRPFDSPEALSRPQAPLAAKSFYFLKSSPFPDFEAFVFLHLQICRMLVEIKSYRAEIMS